MTTANGKNRVKRWRFDNKKKRKLKRLKNVDTHTQSHIGRLLLLMVKKIGVGEEGEPRQVEVPDALWELRDPKGDETAAREDVLGVFGTCAELYVSVVSVFFRICWIAKVFFPPVRWWRVGYIYIFKYMCAYSSKPFWVAFSELEHQIRSVELVRRHESDTISVVSCAILRFNIYLRKSCKNSSKSLKQTQHTHVIHVIHAIFYFIP